MQPLLSPHAPHHPRPGPHQVPFGTLPAQPGSLSHGFGLGPASSFGLGNAWASAQGSSPAWRAGPGWGANGGARTSPVPVPVAAAAAAAGSRRRRRSASGESDDEQHGHGHGHGMRDEGPSPPRTRVTAKRARHSAVAGEGSPSLGLSHAPPVGSTDLGKALASLPKESLLTLLTTLLTTQPSLRPTIAALLPAPTLSTTLTTLSALERAVLSALPAGQHVREDYIWGRIRLPLDSYVLEAKAFLAAFVSPPTDDDELSHPSTTFAFLYALTSSLRRLEVALPATPAKNPLAAHLLPITINAWHALLTRLGGRVLGKALVEGWFERIDELCVDSPGGVEGGAKRACEGVRDRMRRELGWLVGFRAGSATMDDDEL